jgi:hypothetical protein
MANGDSETVDINMSEEEDEEIPSKFIDPALSFEFIHDPVRISKISKFSYERACLERLWDTCDQYNQCPFRTDGRFDIREILPNWNLRKKAEKWASNHRNNSNIPSEGVISCYRRAIMDTEMRQRLKELNDLITLNQPTDDVVTDEVTKKLRRLRLECQYRCPNRRRLVNADGHTLLLDVMRWNSKSPTPTPDLRAEVLRMLIDLDNYLDIPRFLRQHPLALVDIVNDLYKFSDGDLDLLPRGLRFDSFHLLCLAICDWDFDLESDEFIKNLLNYATPSIVKNSTGDESMKHSLPILFYLSSQPSTRSTMSGLYGGLLMRELRRRIEERPSWLSETIQEYEAYRNRPSDPTPSYLEMILRILYNLVLHEEEARLSFLDRNTNIAMTVHRLVQIKVEFPDKLSNTHLHICLQILNTVYHQCAQPRLLSTYVHTTHRPLINILKDSSFSLDIRVLARHILRHYLDLQPFIRNRITR